MYSIIQKIYEKNNKILKEGLKNVLNVNLQSKFTSEKFILKIQKNC